MKPTMTRHALERSKERIGLDRRAAERLAGIALTKGLKLEDLTDGFRWVISRIIESGQGDNVRIYAEKIFIFGGETLITVLPLTNEYKRIVRKIEAAKRRAGK